MEKNYYTCLKRCFTLISLTLIFSNVFGQTFQAKAGYVGQWAFAPGMVHKPTASIYLMGTYQFGDIDQFIKYNVTTNTWSTIPGVPAIKSEFGFTFSVNNHMYFGGGVDQPGTFTNIVHEFTPPSTFTTVDNIPNGPASAFSFGLGNYGYVGNGFVAGFTNLNMMYRFDRSQPSGSQWTTVTSYPGSGKLNCGAAILNGYAYVGLGRSNPGSTEYADFWRYDPNAGIGGSWTAMSPFPGSGRECPIITPVCGKLILMGGVTQSGTSFNDIWQFDPAVGSTGTWTYLGTNNAVYGPLVGRYGPAYAAYGDSLFLGMGYGAAGANTDWKLFTYCPVPLPVELVSFDVNETPSHHVTVAWSTSSEINNDHFEVYRSNDATNWELLQRVDGAGNSNTLNNYQVNDPLPFDGINYYQLKQVDYNGNVTFFEISSVNVKADQELIVFPNPVGNELSVVHNSVETLSYDVINSYGAVVITGTLVNKKSTIQLHSLPAGIYYLRLNGIAESKHKIIKM